MKNLVKIGLHTLFWGYMIILNALGYWWEFIYGEGWRMIGITYLSLGLGTFMIMFVGKTYDPRNLSLPLFLEILVNSALVIPLVFTGFLSYLSGVETMQVMSPTEMRLSIWLPAILLALIWNPKKKFQKEGEQIV